MDLYMHADSDHRHQLAVVNAQGKTLYHIKGLWGRLEDQVILYDASAEELCRATQVLLSLFPKFELSANKQLIAYVSKHLGLQGSYFTVSQLGWTIHDQDDHSHFRIFHQQEVVADIHKERSSPTDRYYIHIPQSDQQGVICLIATLLDHYSPSSSFQTATSSRQQAESQSYFYPHISHKGE